MSLLVHKIIWSTYDALDLLSPWSQKGLLGRSIDEAAVGMMRRLEHSQKEIVLRERGKLLAWNTVRKR